jgi:uncharacterized protein YodC (DUF2158 family)
MSDIKEGDTVRLKSGGPTMTVAEIERAAAGAGTVARCDWFIRNKLETGKFPVGSLMLVDNSRKPPYPDQEEDYYLKARC